MTKPNPNAYGDVVPLMEAAVASDTGIRFRVSTWGEAVNLRLRCYQWRKLKRQLLAEQLGDVPGIVPATPYDGLLIRIEDQLLQSHNKKPATPGPFDLVIAQRQAPKGVLMDGAGNEISLEVSSRTFREAVEPDFDDFDISDFSFDSSPLED